jgi:hypothetical protein
MAIGPQARQRLADLEVLQNRIQHLHGLVERFVAERNDPDQHIAALRRSLVRMKTELTGAGLDAMAQVCASLEIVAKRSGSKPFKGRVLREGIASLRLQLEIEQRLTRTAGEPADRPEAKE